MPTPTRPDPPAPALADGTRRPRVALVSLGCPKNQVDSELILGRLQADGFELVASPDDADTLVVNTCSFIDRARAESVEALLDAAAWKAGAPHRQVVAAGCLVQRYGTDLATEIPEIDSFIGLDDLRDASLRIREFAPAGSPVNRLPAFASAPAPASTSAAQAPQRTALAGAATLLFDGTNPRVRLSPPWTAYVKIAEGCDQNCGFCAIPTFRGRVRSRSFEDLADELARLAADGVVEANLIAQDSTGYGRDIGLKDGLAALVRHIDALDAAPRWIRIHYLYPGRISHGFLDAVAGARRIVPYVDLPLQHAHPDVLRRMRRPGTAETYLTQLGALREAMPGAGMRTGFIVGFPGETDDEFETLCAFVEEAGFDSVGVFTYSHEENTSAHDLDDDVPADVKEERKTILEEIAAATALERNRARLGARLEVLVEGPCEDQPEHAEGRWAGQAPDVDGRVVIEGAAALAAGGFVHVEIVDAAPHELRARLTEAPAP